MKLRFWRPSEMILNWVIGSAFLLVLLVLIVVFVINPQPYPMKNIPCKWSVQQPERQYYAANDLKITNGVVTFTECEDGKPVTLLGTVSIEPVK